MSNGKGDEKFAAWLKRNADDVPKADSGERNRIWEAIERERELRADDRQWRPLASSSNTPVRKPSWSLTSWMMPVAAAAILVLSITIGIFSQRDLQMARGPAPVELPELAQVNEADVDDLIEDSLDLSFLDNGEVMEITALNDLGSR